MKKVSIIPLALCVLISASLPAQALDADSEAQIQFTASEGPTVPVHPEDPTAEENEATGVEGSLAIVKVTDFDFGAITLTTTQKLYDIQTIMPNIQVVDLRGSGAGWQVSAKLSPFTAEGTPTLPGSSIFIYDGRPNSVSVSEPPKQATNTELTTDNTEVLVLGAKVNAGMGLWVMRWYPQNQTEDALVQLSIPVGTATTGHHAASINWILKNVPMT